MTKEKLGNTELFLMDMDGTVYVGNQKIEGAFEALETLKAMGKKVCFLTNNSSKSADSYVKKLASMGYAATEADVYSSAEATVQYLKDNFADKKVYLVANTDVKKYFADNGITSREDADCVVLCFDTELDYNKLVTACNLLQSGAFYIASHPDFVCPASPYPVPDVGSFMALIKAATSREPDVIIGKPYAEMARRVAAKYGITADKIAMCGDRLYTDIRFGVDNGMTSILVLSGETTADMLAVSDVKPDIVLNTFKEVLDLL